MAVRRIARRSSVQAVDQRARARAIRRVPLLGRRPAPWRAPSATSGGTYSASRTASGAAASVRRAGHTETVRLTDRSVEQAKAGLATAVAREPGPSQRQPKFRSFHAQAPTSWTRRIRLGPFDKTYCLGPRGKEYGEPHALLERALDEPAHEREVVFIVGLSLLVAWGYRSRGPRPAGSGTGRSPCPERR